MLSERDIVARVQHVTVTRLRVWVRQGWIRPVDKDRQGFSEADMALLGLLCRFAGEALADIERTHPENV